MRLPRASLAFGSLAWLLLSAPSGAWAMPTPPDLALRVAIALGCDAPGLTAAEMAARLPGAERVSEEPLPHHGVPLGWRRSFALGDGAKVVLDRLSENGALRALVAEYHAPQGGRTRPLLAARAAAGKSCGIVEARRMLYDSRGRASAIEFLDANFAPTGAREALRPPVPAGRDPGGVTVALVDTGVNYLIPALARALARDGAGKALGYDYWTLDDRPFDRHPVLSPFFPEHHGTLVASVLLREAGAMRLIPYRYPRPAMERFAALVDDAAKKGAVILTLSLGSDDAADWESFAAAARRHPEMLIVVSAGNDGRDLDIAPVYPAAFPLANKLTVTDADPARGLPAAGANWGARTVDLAVPAVDIPVIGFDGKPGTASGSSFAAPRVAALAVRLLNTHPSWRAAELKAAILARAQPLEGADGPLVAGGYMADPTAP